MQAPYIHLYFLNESSLTLGSESKLSLHSLNHDLDTLLANLYDGDRARL